VRRGRLPPTPLAKSPPPPGPSVPQPPQNPRRARGEAIFWKHTGIRRTDKAPPRGRWYETLGEKPVPAGKKQKPPLRGGAPSPELSRNTHTASPNTRIYTLIYTRIHTNIPLFPSFTHNWPCVPQFWPEGAVVGPLGRATPWLIQSGRTAPAEAKNSASVPPRRTTTLGGTWPPPRGYQPRHVHHSPPTSRFRGRASRLEAPPRWC
jgi:hypothetical protein